MILCQFTNGICCGLIILRIMLALSIFFQDLLEIKYILYMGALLLGLFIGNSLENIQVLLANAILGSILIVFGINILITIYFLFEGWNDPNYEHPVKIFLIEIVVILISCLIVFRILIEIEKKKHSNNNDKNDNLYDKSNIF